MAKRGSNENPISKSKIAKLENQGKYAANDIFGNSGLSHIPQGILLCLDYESKLVFRQVCQSWKTHVDDPRFWIKKLQSNGQSVELHNSWTDLVGKISKGSSLEEKVIGCLMKWYKARQEYSRRNIKGINLVHITAQFGCTEMFLLASFIDDLNAPMSNGWTPLHIAASYRSTDIFKFLATKVENPNAPLPNGWTPLHIAAQHGRTEIFEFLALKVQNPNLPNPNGLPNGGTPLHIAAQYGSTDIFKFLASKVPNPNAPDPFGWTPLQIAARHGKIEILKDITSFSY